MAMLVAALAVSIAVVAAGNIPSGKSVVAPGTVEGLRSSITVRADPRYDSGASTTPTAGSSSGGDFRLVTVRTWRASFADVAYAAVRSDVEVVEDPAAGEPEEERERRRRSQLLSSELVAQYVAFRSASIPVALTGSGALVEDLSSEPAKRTFRPGDVITAVASVPVKVAEDIRRAVAGRSPGDEIQVDIVREGRSESHTMALSQGPDESRPVVLGILVSTVDPRVESPYEVDFDLTGMGGSSAGLAIALELYVRVTGKDLSRAGVVVATGELDIDGRVRPVGGVEQKARAASQAGADIFVVPRANVDEAIAFAGDTEVLGVSSFEEAVSILEVIAATD